MNNRTILAEIVKYKQSLLQNGYYQDKLNTLKSVKIRQSVRTIEIEAHKITADMHIGDSISVNGACLTVIDFDQKSFTVQVIKSTENKTYLADVKRQSEVNVAKNLCILATNLLNEYIL